MINLHRNFNLELSEEEILEAAERYGYEKFIPIGFIKDLYATWTHAVFGRDPKDAVLIESEYDISLLKLIGMIRYEMVHTRRGTEFAFNVLSSKGDTLNLRQIEAARNSRVGFDFFDLDTQFNYPIDLEQIDPEVLEILDINTEKELNTIPLTEELKYMLKFLEGFSILPGLEKDNPKYVREKMKYYSQISKALKHKLVGPLFQYEFANKTLPVKIPYVHHNDKNTVTLLVDNSTSVLSVPQYMYLYRAILLHYYSLFVDGLTSMQIFYYAYTVNKRLDITQKAQLKGVYHMELVPVNDFYGWTQVFEHFENGRKGEELILLTDGSDESVNVEGPVNNIWNIISLKPNNTLKTLSNISNGKFYVNEIN